jgi:hypothetical protein
VQRLRTGENVTVGVKCKHLLLNTALNHVGGSTVTVVRDALFKLMSQRTLNYKDKFTKMC